MNGRAVSAFEGNTHTAVDDSRDQDGDFELRYRAFHLRGELHDQLIVALQGLVTDDNATAIGALDGKKESACAKILDVTRSARATLDADIGLYLQSLPNVATPVVTGQTIVVTRGYCRASGVGARRLVELAGYGHSLNSQYGAWTEPTKLFIGQIRVKLTSIPRKCDSLHTFYPTSGSSNQRDSGLDTRLFEFQGYGGGAFLPIGS